MKALEDDAKTIEYRDALIQFLNAYELNGMAILAMSNKAQAYRFDPEERIVEQGQQSGHIFFLLSGSVVVEVEQQGITKPIAHSEAVIMLGEIAFFNRIPATATVRIAGTTPAVVFLLTYQDFEDVLSRYPDVQDTLARVGDLRVIRQFKGFISYKMFMEMIGWHRDRFAIHRFIAENLEYKVLNAFKPLLKAGARVLEVGDGPGLISEILYEGDPEMLDRLFLQAAKLEEAIARPHIGQNSDFTCARELKETFDAIVTLQVFNLVSRHAVTEQFQIAYALLNTHGLLFAVKHQMIETHQEEERVKNLIFDDLEKLVQKTWPHALEGKELVSIKFLDADLDPIMTWNLAFCQQVAAKALSIPAEMDAESRIFLEQLLSQAAIPMFDPETLHYRWLGWKAEQHGFALIDSKNDPSSNAFFHLLRKV